MAIELKEEKKYSETDIFWGNALMAVSILFLLISLSMFAYFKFFLISQKTDELTKASAALAALADPEIVSKENELKTAQQDIGDFKLLYENNLKLSKFFDAFQLWAHPKITYTEFNLDVPSRKATMVGLADGFQSIIQQMAIIKSEQSVESFVVSDVALAESGGVSFNLEVVLKADLLK